jgi:hypothetical protein
MRVCVLGGRERGAYSIRCDLPRNQGTLRPANESSPSLSFPRLLREQGESEDVRLLHLVMNWRPSLTNSRGISRNSFAWSIVRDVCCMWSVGRYVERVDVRSGEVDWSVCEFCWWWLCMSRICSNGGRIEDGELVSHVARQLASGVGESCAATGSDVGVQTTFFTSREMRSVKMWQYY